MIATQRLFLRPPKPKDAEEVLEAGRASVNWYFTQCHSDLKLGHILGSDSSKYILEKLGLRSRHRKKKIRIFQ